MLHKTDNNAKNKIKINMYETVNDSSLLTIPSVIYIFSNVELTKFKVCLYNNTLIDHNERLLKKSKYDTIDYAYVYKLYYLQSEEQQTCRDCDVNFEPITAVIKYVVKHHNSLNTFPGFFCLDYVEWFKSHNIEI